MEAQLNVAIEKAATSGLRGLDRLHFVELDSSKSAFNDHNLCRPLQNRNKPWINGLEWPLHPKVYTAHPDQAGHNWIEGQLDAVMKSYLAGQGAL